MNVHIYDNLQSYYSSNFAVLFVCLSGSKSVMIRMIKMGMVGVLAREVKKLKEGAGLGRHMYR